VRSSSSRSSADREVARRIPSKFAANIAAAGKAGKSFNQEDAMSQKPSNPTKPIVDNRPYPRLTEEQKERLGKTFQKSQQSGRDQGLERKDTLTEGGRDAQGRRWFHADSLEPGDTARVPQVQAEYGGGQD
jgi:hypothetical protein